VGHRLAAAGIEAHGFFHDVMLYAFLLSADPSGCSAETLAEKYLDRKLGSTPEQQAETALAVWEKIGPGIESQGLRELYEKVDLPLVPVLARMERDGIRIDPAQLNALGTRMDDEINRLSLEICTIAGKAFNIRDAAVDSPPGVLLVPGRSASHLRPQRQLACPAHLEAVLDAPGAAQLGI